MRSTTCREPQPITLQSWSRGISSPRSAQITTADGVSYAVPILRMPLASVHQLAICSGQLVAEWSKHISERRDVLRVAILNEGSKTLYDAHRYGQKLPITDERPLRKVGISHATDCQREYGEERQLSANQAYRTGAVIFDIVT